MNAFSTSSPRAPRVAALTALAWPFVMVAINGIGTGLVFSVNRLAAEAGIPFIAYVFWAALFAGVVFAMIIFGESLSPWLWAALAFMFAGLATMNAQRPAARRSA